ncbi:MAG: AraC family ligand binding domain-containing protein, partial [Verrucomicrobia bacterium]|nr:AraC family ligand binding domain-containing protein [Verrucomicrobiota bacterium]
MKFPVKVKPKVEIEMFPSPKNFPFYLDWYRSPGGVLHPIKAHREVEIQYIKTGTGAYAIGRHIHSFSRQTVFVIQPNESHRFLPKPCVLVEKAFVAFRIHLLEEPWLRHIITGLPTILRLSEPESTLIETGYRILQAELETKDVHWREIVVRELSMLLIFIERTARRKKHDAIPDARVLKIMDYLESN